MPGVAQLRAGRKNSKTFCYKFLGFQTSKNIFKYFPYSLKNT